MNIQFHKSPIFTVQIKTKISLNEWRTEMARLESARKWGVQVVSWPPYSQAWCQQDGHRLVCPSEAEAQAEATRLNSQKAPGCYEYQAARMPIPTEQLPREVIG